MKQEIPNTTRVSSHGLSTKGIKASSSVKARIRCSIQLIFDDM